jgi:hypothetical protein
LKKKKKKKEEKKVSRSINIEKDSPVPFSTPNRVINIQPINFNEQDADYIEEDFFAMSPKLRRQKSSVIDENEISADDLEFAERFPRGNCLFAAGSTVPKAFIASLYSMAYYTPVTTGMHFSKFSSFWL